MEVTDVKEQSPFPLSSKESEKMFTFEETSTTTRGKN